MNAEDFDKKNATNYPSFLELMRAYSIKCCRDQINICANMVNQHVSPSSHSIKDTIKASPLPKYLKGGSILQRIPDDYIMD